MQIAIPIPTRNKNEPITAKIQPINSGGSSWPGFAVPWRADHNPSPAAKVSIYSPDYRRVFIDFVLSRAAR